MVIIFIVIQVNFIISNNWKQEVKNRLHVSKGYDTYYTIRIFMYKIVYSVHKYEYCI